MPSTIFYKEISTPIGNFFLFANDYSLIKITQKLEEFKLHKKPRKRKDKSFKPLEEIILVAKNTQILKETEKQLKEYFKKKRTSFELPLENNGTELQEKVWKAIAKIPHGKTFNYQKLAEKIKTPSAIRAVASACGKNNLPIVVPCHRVIAKNGSLAGFSLGLEAKKFLLNLEGFVE